jgi:hypothetical protein
MILVRSAHEAWRSLPVGGLLRAANLGTTVDPAQSMRRVVSNPSAYGVSREMFEK